jgi:hypothetical protein
MEPFDWTQISDTRRVYSIHIGAIASCHCRKTLTDSDVNVAVLFFLRGHAEDVQWGQGLTAKSGAINSSGMIVACQATLPRARE